MKITKKQLKKLIREIFNAEREDYVDVIMKAPRGRVGHDQKEKLYPGNITPEISRVHGLQSSDQVKADRAHMTAYQ